MAPPATSSFARSFMICPAGPFIVDVIISIFINQKMRRSRGAAISGLTSLCSSRLPQPAHRPRLLSTSLPLISGCLASPSNNISTSSSSSSSPLPASIHLRRNQQNIRQFPSPLLLTQRRNINYEQRESQYDWLPIKEKIWPEAKPVPPDNRAYVPPAEEDEEDNWKPVESYDLRTKDNMEEGNIKNFPFITPKYRLQQVVNGIARGVGRRKTAVAVAFVRKGTGKVEVNGRELNNYFPAIHHRSAVISPFVATERLCEFDTVIKVQGGGVSAGFLRYDVRQVERKKAGRAKARKKYQWSKR